MKENINKLVSIFKKEQIYRKKYNYIIIPIIMVILSRIVMYFTYEIASYYFEIQNNFINSINIWDCGWYLGIIEKGYQLYPTEHIAGNAANWAFFPLYPLIIKTLNYIFNINVFLLGSIVSTIFFILSLIVGYKYIIETRNDEKQAVFFVILMSFGMYTFYFSILYTESLYLFLLILSLYLLLKEKYIMMGITGALLSATRNLGVMFVFAVLVHYSITYIKSYDNKNIKGYLMGALKDSDLVLGTSLIPLGLFSYMYYLWKKIGDPMAFQHIQIAWNRVISNPIKQLINGLYKGNTEIKYLSMWALIAILTIIWIVVQKRWEECILACIFLLIPLSTGLESIPRYIIGGFIYVLNFTDFIMKMKNRYLWILILILSVVGETVLLFGWLKQYSIFV